MQDYPVESPDMTGVGKNTSLFIWDGDSDGCGLQSQFNLQGFRNGIFVYKEEKGFGPHIAL